MAGWVLDFFLSMGVRRIRDGDGTDIILLPIFIPIPPDRCKIGVWGPVRIDIPFNIQVSFLLPSQRFQVFFPPAMPKLAGSIPAANLSFSSYSYRLIGPLVGEKEMVTAGIEPGTSGTPVQKGWTNKQTPRSDKQREPWSFDTWKRYRYGKIRTSNTS